ncbi:hypothetical protein FXO37_27517 [Capsicum annuum]|nr:hypothetical protein FXO37_27517 [Capsicum annuum]
MNYCGISVCFGLKEFAIVTGLRNDYPAKPLTKKTPRKSSKASRIAKPPPSIRGLVDIIADTMVDLLKKELAGATTIRREARQGQPSVEALHDQTTATNLDASSGITAGGVDVGGRYDDATASHDVEHAVDILLEERKIKVYDCNLLSLDEVNFFTYMHPLLELFHILLRQSKLMDHLTTEVLMKKLWDFEGRNKDMDLSKNETVVPCGSHALAHIECLLTGTEMDELTTFLYDNTVENMQEV